MRFNFGMFQTMSFKRKGPGPLTSGVIGAAAGLAIVGGVIVLLAIPASANTDTRSRTGEPSYVATAHR
jgi:hypothetical protein